MIKTQIPGWGELAIENLILDFNGTIAKDGRVLDGVKELLEKIHDQGVTIYIVTADTNGTVMEECAKLPVEVKIFDSDTVARDKRCLCQSLGCERTASIGNFRSAYSPLLSSATRVHTLNRQCRRTFWSPTSATLWSCCSLQTA